MLVLTSLLVIAASFRINWLIAYLIFHLIFAMLTFSTFFDISPYIKDDLRYKKIDGLEFSLCFFPLVNILTLIMEIRFIYNLKKQNII